MSWLESSRLLKDAFVRLERGGLLQAALRAHALRRLKDLEPDAVTVVIASWNSDDFLPVALEGASRFSDRVTRIIVVDNHSSASPRPIVEQHGARLIRLPVNLRHSVALDVGFLSARTEYVMSLDADAFPFGSSWMSTFLSPLDAGFDVVGCELWRKYAHPCCLAMRTRTFVANRHSFRPNYPVGPSRPEGWDVGELISRRIGEEKVALIPKTGNVGGNSWYVGAQFGDVLYHNLYSSRHLHLTNPEVDGMDESDDFVMTRSYALNVWNEALRCFGPDTW